MITGAYDIANNWLANLFFHYATKLYKLRFYGKQFFLILLHMDMGLWTDGQR